MSDGTEALLVVESGVPGASMFPVTGPSQVIGKSPEADIVLDNPYVSRRHAEIAIRQDSYEIRDLGSKNGTFVNGEPAGAGRTLRGGDRVEFGRGQVVLRFQEPGATITLMAVHNLVLDARAREVWFKGQPLKLSPKEYSVLEHLYLHRGEACSKDSIAGAGWPEHNGDVGDQDVEQVIRRLRRRIEPDSRTPRYILTVKGFGYKLSQR